MIMFLFQFPQIEGKNLKSIVIQGFEDVEFVSSASQDADATVIIPSQQESTIVGNISRRGSLVRFPKPKELLETMTVETQQKLVRGAATSSSLRNSNPAQSSRRKRKKSEPSSSKHLGSGS
ncbi:hypothetical protein F2Q68_00019029 [Brassica cretica]|uniref:Uncharacterized protein n=1 Tax=Brassica cretica TaxID=69181 RepID=A0A8S9FYH2_BRACR|nr:hypothetical protein F2Q68_00019029 [Brassica cretica]